MNIFKKTLDDGFFQRIRIRLVERYKQEILANKKRSHKIISLIFGGSCLGLFSVYFFDRPFHDIFYFISIMFGFSFLLWIAYGSDLRRNFKKACRYGDTGEYDDEDFIRIHFKNNDLNEEEMNELFNLSLNSVQIVYLQNLIIEYGIITFEDLLNMPYALDISLEEQKNLKQKELNDFFSENNINTPYSTLLVSSEHSQEKEKLLSSRL